MPDQLPKYPRLSRRALLARLLASAALFAPFVAYADARIAASRAVIGKIVAGRTPVEGGIKLTTPAIAENGNTVPIAVEVDSPFSVDDYVRAVHIFAEENPTPEVITFHYTPLSGRAKNATRIRLAKTQRVIAIAEMSDGRVLRAANEVKVTIGGCGG